MDRYAKSVLTVIAAALVVIASGNIIKPSIAQQLGFGAQKVLICDSGPSNVGGPPCLDLQEIKMTGPDGMAVSQWALPVVIEKGN